MVATRGRWSSLVISGQRLTARCFAEPTLRSLDAIHLAIAQVLTNESGAELVAFVTYGRRLLDAAKAAGLPTASPGQTGKLRLRTSGRR
ncbi:hypothetical protein DLJ58_25050 [Micromonospora arida]|uniref:PIN domain-containing protein n=1 Tax=Micromonospora arida TaxID=2203715 RepID=A0A3N9WYH9_9ACTN|nr:hypothetical protein DLJ58_25050 [Micromonospora arida]